jgi:hypothetical protein
MRLLLALLGVHHDRACRARVRRSERGIRRRRLFGDGSRRGHKLHQLRSSHRIRQIGLRMDRQWQIWPGVGPGPAEKQSAVDLGPRNPVPGDLSQVLLPPTTQQESTSLGTVAVTGFRRPPRRLIAGWPRRDHCTAKWFRECGRICSRFGWGPPAVHLDVARCARLPADDRLGKSGGRSAVPCRR